jgi:GMP synthase (glutamine-hydrolysing)
MQTGTPDGLKTYDSFWEMFFDEGGCGSQDTLVIDVSKGESLASPADYSSAIITGSPAMVTDHLDWSERAAEWVREAVQCRLPLLGVCYGHQLMAYALGGGVAYLDGGVELGTLDIYMGNLFDNPLFNGLPKIFKANLVHSQTVTKLPPDAFSIAYSERDPNQIIIYNDITFSVQFHPEYSGKVMKDYIELYKAESPQDAEKFSKLAAEDTPESRDILRKFIEYYAD